MTACDGQQLSAQQAMKMMACVVGSSGTVKLAGCTAILSKSCSLTMFRLRGS
jgi:hypothetical protein